jgi:hypothetical protein
MVIIAATCGAATVALTAAAAAAIIARTLAYAAGGLCDIYEPLQTGARPTQEETKHQTNN